MPRLNEIAQQGRLASNVMIRFTGAGERVGNFLLAVPLRKRFADGWKELPPMLFDVSTFEEKAIWRLTGLKKGDEVRVRGKLSRHERCDVNAPEMLQILVDEPEGLDAVQRKEPELFEKRDAV